MSSENPALLTLGFELTKDADQLPANVSTQAKQVDDLRKVSPVMPESLLRRNVAICLTAHEQTTELFLRLSV